MFTVKQVAQMLGLTISGVYYRIKNRIDLVAVRIGGRVYLTDESVLRATRRAVTGEKFKRRPPANRKKRVKKPLKKGEEWKYLARKSRRGQRALIKKIYRDAVKEEKRRRAIAAWRKAEEKKKRLLRRGGAKG